MIFTN